MIVWKSMRAIIVLLLIAFQLGAQERLRQLQQPWEGVPAAYRNLPIGHLEIPATRQAWERQRNSVKEIALQCLGDRPPRPSPLSLRTVAVDQKDGYKIEKFVFDNGVDSQVPGYIAIPDKQQGRLPAILTMHGHGSNKGNMFGYQPTSQNVAEHLVRRGYVVLGIDEYFEGERRGTGPAGDQEPATIFMKGVGYDQEVSLFKLNLWLGRTLWGMMLRDEQIALDYLVSRPEVDPNRIRRPRHEYGEQRGVVAGGDRRSHQGCGGSGMLYAVRRPDRDPRAVVARHVLLRPEYPEAFRQRGHNGADRTAAVPGPYWGS